MTSATTHIGRLGSIPSREAADRLAIRDLIDAFAHFADRRQPEEQAALYADYARTMIYTDRAASEPAHVLAGRDEHVEAFRALSKDAATMHFIGQVSIGIDGDRATGETYMLAYHMLATGQGRGLSVEFVRYEDSFVKRDGTWRFAERRVHIDWTDGGP